jgi:hypothetical protein
MKKDETLRQTRAASEAVTDTERIGPEALIRHTAYQRLCKLRGSEKNAADIPRRREPARRK